MIDYELGQHTAKIPVKSSKNQIKLHPKNEKTK